MDTWEWARTVKSFVSHFNVHQKASTMGEALNNQVDKMTQPFDMNQSTINHLELAGWAQEQSGHGRRDRGIQPVCSEGGRCCRPMT